MFPVSHPFSPSLRLRSRKAHAFSLTEILVALGVIAVVAALLFPAMQRAQKGALDAQCQSNLRQIGVAFAAYRAENQGALPKVYDPVTTMYWFHQLLGVTPDSNGANYLGSSKVLRCALNPKTEPTFNTLPPTAVGYGMLDALIWRPTSHRAQDEPKLLFKVSNLANWPLVMDAEKLAIYSLDNPTKDAAGDARFHARHSDRANILMADGHIEKAAYGDKRWTQQALNDLNLNK